MTDIDLHGRKGDADNQDRRAVEVMDSIRRGATERTVLALLTTR